MPSNRNVKGCAMPTFRPFIYIVTEDSNYATQQWEPDNHPHNKMIFFPDGFNAGTDPSSFNLVSAIVRSHYSNFRGYLDQFGTICGYRYCPAPQQSYAYDLSGTKVSANLGGITLEQEPEIA
jgi:hypothetical protein